MGVPVGIYPFLEWDVTMEPHPISEKARKAVYSVPLGTIPDYAQACTLSTGENFCRRLRQYVNAFSRNQLTTK